MSRLICLLGLLDLALVGCIDEPCDPGSDERAWGICLPVRMASAVTPDAGAGRDAGGGADGSAGVMDGGTDAPRRYAGFGDPCTTDKDCKLDATFCGLGQCTAIDCLDAPELCPPEWICYDVLKVMPDSEVASACVPPGVL